MILETSWLNDDFIKDQFRVRIKDEINSVEFVIKRNQNKNINDNLYNRLVHFKMNILWRNLKMLGIKGYLGSHDLTQYKHEKRNLSK